MIITPEIFEKRLNEIVKETRSKVTALVIETRKDNLGDDFTKQDASLDTSFTDNPQIERLADTFVELGGWIYDRLNGRTRMDKKSITRKLRKVLGYMG
jgi:hypothetical protein